jgi:iron(III) transport system substrate-binding protein
VFEPYEPKGSRIADQFRDPDSFYVNHWLTLMVFAVNTKMSKDRNLAIPAKWEDLTNPAYKGLITVASPTKSGTGLTIFTTLVDAFGWDYLDKLHPNIAQYNSGGGAAGRQAGVGEAMVGMTYDTPVLEQIKAVLPVEMVFPNLTPNVTEGGGLIAKSPKPARGKLWLDFVASPEGAAIYKPFVGATTTPGVSNLDLAKVNLYKMKKPVNLDDFKREWAKRYEK